MGKVAGVNDRKTLKSKRPFTAFSVHKGMPKKNVISKKTGKEIQIYGDDLEAQYRVTAEPKVIKKLLTFYQSATVLDERNLLVSYLNIVFGFSAGKDTFHTEMNQFRGSKIQRSCDGLNIYAEYQTDNKGKQTKINCHKPCAKGDNKDCPLGCKLSGTLYFYILELLVDGNEKLGSIDVGTREDCQFVQHFLDELEDDLAERNKSDHAFAENIKNSPVISEEFRAYKPVVLKKRLKYNAHYKRNYSYLDLELHPNWVRYYRNYELAREVRLLGHQPDRALIEKAHGAKFMRNISQVNEALPQSSSSNSLPGNIAWQPSSEQLNEIETLYEQNNWTKEGLNKLIRDRYNLTDISQVKADQWSELRNAIASPTAREMFCT